MKHTTWMFVALIGCGSGNGVGPDGHAGGDGHNSDGAGTADAPAVGARTVFVIPMENKPSSGIYGNTTDAPYINGLLASAAHATMFQDELPALVSEPHYVWMEAGTNAFSDHTFSGDSDSSTSNSTTSTAHLVTQLGAAHISWTAYQQGITTGTCPIASSGAYAAKHDPFVFFKDVAGSPPSASAPICSAHHRSYADFAHDLQAGVSGYVFITPDLCHDMHGDSQCASGTGTASNIKAGDAWLAAELPAIIAYTQSHNAVIFLTWDEGDSSNLIPFLAIGKHAKAGATSATPYTHGSMIKSIEEYLGVPVLGSVASTSDFAGMFEAGSFP